MQKTYTPDYLTKRAAPNLGQFPQYYIKDNHPAIISKNQWEIAQLETARRQSFRKTHQIRELSNISENPLSSRCFCSKCGARLLRRKSQKDNLYVWFCPGIKPIVQPEIPCGSQKKTNKLTDPHGMLITDRALLSGFILVWNHLLLCHEIYMLKWNLMANSGDPLQQFYANRMMELTSSIPYSDLESYCDTLIRMTVEKILVSGDGTCQVHFLDGTII